MDCEALISAVYNHRALWDMSHPHHHHRGVLDKSWSEVSRRMKVTVSEARHKWKYLRDHYRKELKKFPNGQSVAGYEPTWCYFHSLSFLRDQMQVPKDEDSCSSQSQQDEDTQLQSISLVKLEAQEFDVFDDETPDDVKSLRAQKRPFSCSNLSNAKHQRLEERHQPSSNNQEELCDDYHFFMSLVPMMKKFNDLQKMRMRSQFQQIILEGLSQLEEYQNN